ncbi:MAG: hypothetical protein EPN97_09195 [Alphaproteobacteria bacterium]|nr:MAG: hypothetical protein EPN97_09195 [Alphaproteobacteria bacterium]
MKFVSAIKRLLIAASICFLVVTYPIGGPANAEDAKTVPTPPHGVKPLAQQRAEAAAKNGDKKEVICPESISPALKNSKVIALFIGPPKEYDLVFKCHGREESCANNNQEFIQQLKKKYESFPPSLRPENLEVLFSNRIKRMWQSNGMPQDRCHAPPLVVNDRQYALTPGIPPSEVLRVAVGLYFQEDVKPHVAILGVHLMPTTLDYGLGSCVLSWSCLRAISLDSPDEEISRMVADFVDSSIIEPQPLKR